MNNETKLLQAMGDRARERREELGITVNQLAVKMSRTYQCIHGMEKSGTGSIRVLLEWAEALSTTPHYLAFGGHVGAMQMTDVQRELLASAGKAIDARSGPRRELVKRIREELGT